jgi:hypothetical protein
MPTDVAAQLDRGELRDLVEFLSRQVGASESGS